MKVFAKLFSRKKGKIGLALGGGAVLGAAHVGVIKALDEMDIKIDYIAGTSIGAIIASLFAFGKKWKDIKEIVLGYNWLDITGLCISRYGLLSDDKLADIFYQAIGKADFKDADIPLAVVATDISTGEKVVLRTGDVAEAVMASACIPGIYIPVRIGDKLLVDGGIVENVPISPLRDMGAKTVIAVKLSSKMEMPRNILEVMINSMHFSIQQTTKLQVRDADILLNIELSRFNPISTRQVPSLIKTGYEQAKNILSKTKLTSA